MSKHRDLLAGAAEERVRQLLDERDVALRELAKAGRLWTSAGLPTPEARQIELDYLDAMELVQRKAQMHLNRPEPLPAAANEAQDPPSRPGPKPGRPEGSKYDEVIAQAADLMREDPETYPNKASALRKVFADQGVKPDQISRKVESARTTWAAKERKKTWH